jgi:hypothetical protein
MTFTIGTPFARNAGYFRSDDRVSGGRLQEDDVKTCPHCQAVILMRQWRKIEAGKMNGGFCQKCNAPLCASCTPKLLSEGCLPYIARLERDFDMTVKLRQFQKLAGLAPEPARGFFTGLISSKD